MIDLLLNKKVCEIIHTEGEYDLSNGLTIEFSEVIEDFDGSVMCEFVVKFEGEQLGMVVASDTLFDNCLDIDSQSQYDAITHDLEQLFKMSFKRF